MEHLKGPEKEGKRDPIYYPSRTEYVDGLEDISTNSGSLSDEDRAKLDSLKNYTLPAATASTLGGVKIGSGVNVSADGTISVEKYTLPTANSSALGGVKIGSGVNVSADGTISIEKYTLPTANSSALGGVKIGSGINVSADGTISVETGSLSDEDRAKLDNLKNYTLPTATNSTLGGVKIGSGVNVSADGTISVENYTLPTATSSNLGGVKVGSGIIVNEGTISVNDFTGATSSKEGSNGHVPAPKAGDQKKFLCADGTWAVPPSMKISTIPSDVDGVFWLEE